MKDYQEDWTPARGLASQYNVNCLGNKRVNGLIDEIFFFPPDHLKSKKEIKTKW